MTEVAENNAGQDGSTEEASSLDDILKEYSIETEKVEETKKVDDRIDKVLNYFEQDQAEKADKALKESIQNAVKTVQDGLDLGLSDRIVRGYLNDLANDDARFLQAFNDRDKNPTGWQRALLAAQKELKEEFKVDQKATEDRKALEAAAKTGTASTDPPDYSSMSDAEFEQHKRSLRRG